MILVIAEQRDGRLNRATWEALAAAQALGDTPVEVAVAGASLDAVARELATSGVAEVLASGVPSDGLIGVGITGQWGSTVPVDAGGGAVGPCLLWADTRGGPLSARRMGGPISIVGYSPGNLVRWLRFTGGAPSPHGARPQGSPGTHRRSCSPRPRSRWWPSPRPVMNPSTTPIPTSS